MPKILISYRREDSDAFTGRIRDRLVLCYGEKDVFMDVEDIPFGSDFRAHIRDQILKCDVVLVVIGPKWLGRTATGGTRLAEDTDPVRLELETAVAATCRTIPVLINGAAMPQPSEVPASLTAFCYLNAATIGGGSDFHPNLERLISRLEGPSKEPRKSPSRSPSKSLSARRPQAVGLLGVAAFACIGLLALGAAYVGWRPSGEVTHKGPMILLLPPEYRSETRRTQNDVFKKIWGYFAEGLLPQQVFAVLPPPDRADALDNDGSEFQRLFGEWRPWPGLSKNLIKYENSLGQRVAYLVRPNIEVHRWTVRRHENTVLINVELQAIDTSIDRDKRLPRTITDASRPSLRGNQSHADIMAAVVSWRLVSYLIANQSSSADGLLPAPEQAIAQEFLRLFRKTALTLPPVDQVALPGACATFKCIDEIADKLAERVELLGGFATAQLDSTLAETYRLNAGGGAQ